MKIKTYGYRFLTDQISRIEQGFKNLGHEIVADPSCADLIYINDRTFEDLEILKKYNCKKVFNILDVPYFNMNGDAYKRWKYFLSHADKVTCISEKVKKDVKYYLNIDAQVIYNPAKDVYNNGINNKDPRMLFVGRANEPTKRFNLIKSFFSFYKLNDKKLLYICGTENPNVGNYLGLLSDDELNEQYNLSNIVLCPSIFEGIGLPLIESLICKKMPIACIDNETAREFLPVEFLCEPNIQSINNKIRDYFKNKQKYDSIISDLSEKYTNQFNKNSIAKNIINII